PVHPAAWSWRRWALSAGPERPVHTCRAPLARPPALVPGSWAALVLSGVAIALGLEGFMTAHEHLRPGWAVGISLFAVLVGAVASKLWFLVLHRHDGRKEGWCIQGLVAGLAVVLPGLLFALDIPIAAFLDSIAPSLMLGLGIGRLGCFFGGCCVG